MVNNNSSKLAICLDMFRDINGGASTKRIIGCIGYICGLVLAFMHYDESLVAIVLTSAVSLIIGTALEKKYDEEGNVVKATPSKSHKEIIYD